MKYDIKYENLEDELVKNGKDMWYFEQVRNTANKSRVELSDKDFERLFKLQKSDKNVNWILSQMGRYNMNLTDVLISYMTY